MSAIKESIDSYITTYPLPEMSMYKIFQCQEKYLKYREWSTNHPLYGRTIPLKHPIIYFTKTAKRREISELIAANIERFGDSWRISGKYGLKFFWLDKDNIDWTKLK